MLLADAAQAVGGKMYVMGGGWTHVLVPQFPGYAPAPFSVAVGITVPYHLTNRRFAVSCSESITRSTSSKLRPVVIGYTRISLIFLSGPITKTLRTVALSAGVREVASPETSAPSIPYAFAILNSGSPIIG